MIVSIAMLKRKKSLTREQFLHHYEKIHAPMFLAKNNVPGVRKYVQNHPAKGTGPEFESDIDGISEMWFDDIESLKAFRQWLESSPEAEDLRKDGELFIDVEKRLPLFLAEEHVMKEW
jgi:uncharacterized protein (TIGR02118 family)